MSNSNQWKKQLGITSERDCHELAENLILENPSEVNPTYRACAVTVLAAMIYVASSGENLLELAQKPRADLAEVQIFAQGVRIMDCSEATWKAIQAKVIAAATVFAESPEGWVQNIRAYQEAMASKADACAKVCCQPETTTSQGRTPMLGFLGNISLSLGKLTEFLLVILVLSMASQFSDRWLLIQEAKAGWGRLRKRKKSYVKPVAATVAA